MRIQAGDGDARRVDSAAAKEVVEQQADANDFRTRQGSGYVAERKVDGYQGYRQFPAGKQHREILDTATLGEEFCLAGELETDLVHPGLVNRGGDDRVELAAQSERGRFLQCVPGGAGSFRRRLA